ncbi:MAG: hypothetical protein PGN24_04660, partial [Microbacterium arborescens]
MRSSSSDAHFRDGRLRSRAVLGLDALASLYAAVAEAYAGAGLPRDAGGYAAHALTFADTDAVRYRAASVQTLVLALNGELTAAEAMAGRCAELTASNGWSLLDTDYDLVLAEILLASAAFDAPRLKRAATLLRAIAPRDPYAQHAAAAADGIR